MSTTRHNEVAACISKMLTESKMQVRSGENARWIRGRKDLRPFDVVWRKDASDKWTAIDVGIADPTRLSNLPSGKQYFKSGMAAARLADDKRVWLDNNVKDYGGLVAPVEYSPVVFETTGAWGKSAANCINKIIRQADKAGVHKPGETGSWNAQAFSSYWKQRLSFTISKYTAISVLLGCKAVAKVHTSPSG